MKIELKEITIKEVSNGYFNDNEEGVVGFGGILNIRPKYQREFVYKDKQRNSVIETVQKNFPLNVMYWVKNDDGSFEVLDGQQRTISICEFVEGSFSIENFYFHNLQNVEKEQILDYKLMIYFCEGNDKEKLDWFKTINIAGEKLTDQELRNAIYTGTWLTDAKRYFSKTGCPAYSIGSDYMTGSPIRQDYLETIIKWISDNEIEQYMAVNQHNPNANELWMYFNSVMTWVKTLFPNYRREMKGVDFGTLYNEYKNTAFDARERELSIRKFTDRMKREAYERQQGICPVCTNHFEIAEMEGDHITPWHSGGRSISSNCQMLCKADNRSKSGV